jgi:signal transduction histidine kinase
LKVEEYTYKEQLAKWAIKARYLSYPIAVLLVLLFFKNNTVIYKYFSLASVIALVTNVLCDYFYKFIKLRHAIGIFLAILDAAITSFAVFLTGGFHSPFFILFLLQIMGVGLLGNAVLTIIFFLIDTIFYTLAAYSNLLLRNGSFVFINNDITRIINQVRLERIDFVLINVSIFVLVVIILAVVNQKLSAASKKMFSDRKKLDFLLTVMERFRKLEPFSTFLDETTAMISDMLGYRYNAIVLLNNDKTELYMNAYNPKIGEEKKIIEQANNLFGYELKDMSLAMSNDANIVVKAVKEMTTLVTHDAWDILIGVTPAITKEIAGLIQQLTGNKAYIVTPIIVFGNVIGVLEAESKSSHVDTDTIELLERFASQIGVSIINNRLYTETLNQKKEIEEHYQEMNFVLGELQLSYSKLEDFTKELERSKNKLEEMEGVLYHADRLANMGQVIASITHQFSSPISALSGQIELLIKELNDKNIDINKDRIEKIKLSINKLDESVRKLMLSVRLTKPEFRNININDIVNLVASLWEYELKIVGIELVKKLNENLPDIQGIPDAIEQLLVNLISNAKDAMGDRKGTIIISTRIFDTDNVEIEIEDEGVGIPDEYLSKIFTPFFTTKPAGKGTGLGMVIVMNAVEEHDGRIMVKSELNKGTTFTIILPIRHGHNDGDTKN